MSLDGIVGYKHFADYFSAFRGHYVVIGGIATMFSLEVAGQPSRPTKDIDLVILANPDITFADRLREYVTLGGYEIEGDSGSSSQNFRFRRPKNTAFPFQIEIFSTWPIDLQLHEDQKIIPFSTSPGLKSLSAILMDRDYFMLVRDNVTQNGAVPLLTVDALIPLKVKAFLDLDERRAKGEQVDKKEIKKHRNDVLRLSSILGDVKRDLPPSVALDLKNFFECPEVLALGDSTIADVTRRRDLSIEQIRRMVLLHFDLY